MDAKLNKINFIIFYWDQSITLEFKDPLIQ